MLQLKDYQQINHNGNVAVVKLQIMNQPKLEDVRIQVSISYNMPKNKDDNKLLDLIKDTDNFKASENQMWGCGCIPLGFMIFQGEKIPTKEDKRQMIDAVKNAIKLL